MKILIVNLFIIIPVLFVLSCSKDDTKYSKVGILYRPNESKEEKQNTSSKVEMLTTDQVEEKLTSIDNNTKLFHHALRCKNQGDYSRALLALNILSERNNNYPKLFYHKGLIFRNMGLQDEAICAFQIAITQNPDFPEAHYNLGYAYQRKGLYTEAVEQYKKALKFIPDRKSRQKAHTHLHLGSAYFAMGLIDNAIVEYETANTFSPENEKIHQKLGIAYAAKGWKDKAKDEFSIYKKTLN